MSGPAASPGQRPAGADVFRIPGFPAFWTAETVSGFGTYITTLALQVLVVLTLHGTATDVGVINAARWLPYLVFGLVVGAMVDRWRRKPILVSTDLARALLLGAIPALWLLGWLSLPVLAVFVAVFGLMTLLNDAASQSFVPRIVPPRALLEANARLDQGATAAQTTGPALAGTLVSAVGAPVAVLVDAATYLFSAVVIARLRVTEPPPAKAVRPRPHLGRDIAEGLRFVYRHRMLAQFAVSTHAWFVFNSLLTTVFVPFVLLELRLSAFEMGLALAAAGVTGLVGSFCAAWIGRRWGAGGAVIACRAVMPLGWATIALAPAGLNPWALVAVMALGQGLYGLGMGASNANEMAYRQAVTPDALQARMNTTMRSINRGMIVLGAPLGGLLADTIGYRPTLWIGVTGFLLGAAHLALSPFRSAKHGDAAEVEDPV